MTSAGGACALWDDEEPGAPPQALGTQRWGQRWVPAWVLPRAWPPGAAGCRLLALALTRGSENCVFRRLTSSSPSASHTPPAQWGLAAPWSLREGLAPPCEVIAEPSFPRRRAPSEDVAEGVRECIPWRARDGGRRWPCVFRVRQPGAGSRASPEDGPALQPRAPGAAGRWPAGAPTGQHYCQQQAFFSLTSLGQTWCPGSGGR